MTDAEIQEASALWKAGHTVTSIASKFGVRTTNIRAIAESRRHLFPVRHRKHYLANNMTAEVLIRKINAVDNMKEFWPEKAPGFDGVTTRELSHRRCGFPLWGHHEHFDVETSLYCGAPRPGPGPYCTFHQRETIGYGTKSENEAGAALLRVAGGRIAK